MSIHQSNTSILSKCGKPKKKFIFKKQNLAQLIQNPDIASTLLILLKQHNENIEDILKVRKLVSNYISYSSILYSQLLGL